MPQLYPRFLFFLLSLFLIGPAVQGQTVRISQGDVRVCSGIFTDSGGQNGDHTGAGNTQQITICSNDGGANTHMLLTFQELAIEGELTVYDGQTTGDPVLFVIMPTETEGFRVRASEGNNSGCLTFVFVSTGNGAGWQASIECVRSCQEIEGSITTTPTANLEPSGNTYVDICPGDPITFNATTNYPDNNVRYFQSDATSTFIWNFQDGTVRSGVNLTQVTYTYDVPGAYLVQLTVEDADGCTNTNQISQRVRVAPPPIFESPANLPNDVCIGEEVNLVVGTPGAAGDVTFLPTPVPFSFNTSQTFTELTPLPDGTGVVFSSPLVFSNFNPGQALLQSTDLVRICASMEHSYLGDLDIWITCPDGSRVDLHTFDRNDQVERQLLGQGNRSTNPPNDPPDPPGLYCWTAAAPLTMAQYVVANNVRDNQTMPEIDYAAEDSFNALIGCPLNGEWSLNIRDNLSNDSGHIFEWSIEFINSLYPGQETFVVPIADYRFQNFQNFTTYNGDNAVFAGTDPGPNTIRIITTDDYGCAYDTSIVINVLPPYAAACRNCGPLVDRDRLDTAICVGSSFLPNVAGSIDSDEPITFRSFANAPFGNSLYPSTADRLSNPITISGFAPDRITDVATELTSICVDLENAGDLSDVTIQVIAPNGRILTLLENFGGNGEDLTQTCFSPTATAAIGTATAPYTGTFRAAAGGWTSFNTSRINGTWQLVAWDRQGNDLGQLIGWSISFAYDRGFSYTWTPNDGTLSCTDCPNPTMTPTGPTTYNLAVTTADGCTDQATVNITLNSFNVNVAESLTNPTCPGTATGAIDLVVTGDEPNYFYLWEDGTTAEDRSLLNAGTYRLTISNAAGCQDSFTYVLTERPLLTVTLDEVIDASCFGGSTGEIRVTTTGGTAPYTFLWNDPNAQNDEDAGSLTQGTYTLRVTDAVGCTTTFTETVNQPTDLGNTFRSDNISCRNGNDGYAVAIATGGNGGYRYAWSNGGSQDSIFNLPAGTYEVTITDRLGCTMIDAITLTEPATQLTAVVTQTEQGCFNAAANRATVTPSGGSGGYTYLWSNGETTATAIALPAGVNSVEVTDSGGCVETFTITLRDLQEITINIIATVPSCNNRTDGRLGAIPTGGAGSSATDYTYAWSNGGSDVAIVNLPGDVLYRVTVTGPRGCTGEAERFLAAPPPITFTVDETPVVCNGESSGGLAISNINGPNSGNYDLQWGPGAGNSTSPTVSGLPAGSYRLLITDVEGCTVDTSLRISEPPVLSVGLNKIDVSCFGEADGRISATGTGGVGGYQYNWSNGSSQNQIVSLQAGNYTLTVTDANQCTFITSVDILQPEPINIAASSEAAICAGDATGTINVTGTGGRRPYLFGLENQGFTRNATFIGLQAGDYIAFIRDSSGCQATTAVTVADGPVFTMTLPQDTTIIFGDSLTLTPAIIGGVDTIRYNWRGSYDGTLSCTDCPTPLAQPEYEIDYSLFLTDANGCTADDRFRVSVRKIREVAVPTGFTPNGDAQNDRLIVHGRPGTRVLSFIIFDRWANVLYEASDFAVNDVAAGWDGTVNDQPVNAGVYLYKMVIQYEDNSQEILAGETTLIR